MSSDAPHELTFDRLQQFLRRLGFQQPAKLKQSLAFHHPQSGTIIALSIPSDGRTIRPADLTSVLMRLEAAALVDHDELQQMKSGKLPMAS